MSIAQKLLQWYHKNGRDLPWRGTTDPYRILVSEIMLQQTQVSRGLLYFDAWLKRFPDWQTLAHASNADVIHAWAGLGYNRRALILRDIARQIIENGVPQSREAWLALKGIGPYTSAALTVFSLHQPAVPIDTNIRRVLGRIFFGKPYPQPADDTRIEHMYKKELIDTKEFYEIPQALFDLATMHCTKVPDCSVCKMKDVCKASKKFLSGSVEPPKQMVKKAAESAHRNKRYPDRIYRGRILKLVREQGTQTDIDHIGSVIDASYNIKLDHDWVQHMIDRLIADQLLRLTNSEISLG